MYSVQEIFQHHFPCKKVHALLNKILYFSLTLPTCLAVVEQYYCQSLLSYGNTTGFKNQFYCTAYYIMLNSFCEAQRVSKNLKIIVEDTVRNQNNAWVIWVYFFYFLRGKICLQSLNKIRPHSPEKNVCTWLQHHSFKAYLHVWFQATILH